MDLVLNYADQIAFNKIYANEHVVKSFTYLSQRCNTILSSETCSNLISNESDSVLRQSLSLFALTYMGIFFLYFGFAIASYYLIFDHRIMQHKRFLPNQIKQEIKLSMDSFVPVGLMTVPFFLGDVRGYSQLYDTVADSPLGGGTAGWVYMVGVTVAFLLFTDAAIYWVHRILHWPVFYKRIHKPHHRFIIPTPFASHAFHPLDGFVNGLPYHFFVYVVPVHKHLFIALFLLVNLWTIFIHDSEMISNSPLEAWINGPSHHTLHHLYFTVNYGQYFTFADRYNNSFRAPAKGEDPLLAILNAQAASAALKLSPTIILSTTGESEESSNGSDESEDDDSGFEEVEGLMKRKKVE